MCEWYTCKYKKCMHFKGEKLIPPERLHARYYYQQAPEPKFFDFVYCSKNCGSSCKLKYSWEVTEDRENNSDTKQTWSQENGGTGWREIKEPCPQCEQILKERRERWEAERDAHKAKNKEAQKEANQQARNLALEVAAERAEEEGKGKQKATGIWNYFSGPSS